MATLLQQSRPNCAHSEHMLLPFLDSRLDSSERIRPAVIKDHPNKEMAMTVSKLFHWRQSEFFPFVLTMTIFTFGVCKVSVRLVNGWSIKKTP